MTPHRRTSRLPLLAAAFLALAVHPLCADPVEDLKRFTLFGGADLSPLANGMVLGERGELPAHLRGISVETLFFVPVDSATAAERIRTWEPRQDSGLDVFVHRRVAIPLAPDTFAALASLPNAAPIDRLRAATLGLNPSSPSLYMSRAEAAGIQEAKAAGGDPNQVFATFWNRLLSARATAALTAGIAFTPPCQIGDSSISVAQEISALLASNKKIRSQFGRLVAFSRLAGRYAEQKDPPLPQFTASKGIKLAGYWEVFNVQGEGTINLGATFALGADNGQWQVIDSQYYVSGGYITSLVLYQLWPATIGGRQGTLIWRGDLLSSPGFTYVRGVERQATGMVMLQEVKKSVEQLRRDIGR